jgi:hypothetical protein
VRGRNTPAFDGRLWFLTVCGRLGVGEAGQTRRGELSCYLLGISIPYVVLSRIPGFGRWKGEGWVGKEKERRNGDRFGRAGLSSVQEAECEERERIGVVPSEEWLLLELVRKERGGRAIPDATLLMLAVVEVTFHHPFFFLEFSPWQTPYWALFLDAGLLGMSLYCFESPFDCVIRFFFSALHRAGFPAFFDALPEFAAPTALLSSDWKLQCGRADKCASLRADACCELNAVSFLAAFKTRKFTRSWELVGHRKTASPVRLRAKLEACLHITTSRKSPKPGHLRRHRMSKHHGRAWIVSRQPRVYIKAKTPSGNGIRKVLHSHQESLAARSRFVVRCSGVSTGVLSGGVPASDAMIKLTAYVHLVWRGTSQYFSRLAVG